jgi:hypothetical protein
LLFEVVMRSALLLVLFFAAEAQTAREAGIRQQIDAIARSGRVLEAGETRARLVEPMREIAPGAPPLLSFRYFQGADRHRFGKLDVMLDDAGH